MRLDDVERAVEPGERRRLGPGADVETHEALLQLPEQSQVTRAFERLDQRHGYLRSRAIFALIGGPRCFQPK